MHSCSVLFSLLHQGTGVQENTTVKVLKTPDCDQTNLSEISWRRLFLSSLPALILSAACLLPYINKAFTIDDPFFLSEAQQVRKVPLQPTGLTICWVYDATCSPVAHTMFLMAYLLAPIVNSPLAEPIAHLMQIVLLWCGILATVSLAFRFGLGTFAAWASGLLVAAMPPVLAMASTAMPDILAMSLGVIGIERLVAWKAKGKVLTGIVTALALGLAPIARLHLVFLWAIGVLLLRDDSRVFDIRSWIAMPKRRWIPLIGAGLVMWVVLAITQDPVNRLHPTPLLMNPMRAFLNLRSYFLYWVLAMPLALSWLILRNRRLLLWLFPIGLALVVLGRMFYGPRPGWGTLGSGLGAFVLMDVLLSSYQRRDLWRIACALWLLIPLVALPYMDFPVKFLVMCAPAVALLIADQLSCFPWRNAALGGIIAAGAIFGGMVLSADAQFAEMGRLAAKRLVAPQVAAGQKVWVSSQWGFYWYSLKAGAQVLKPGDVPAPGDYLVRGAMEGYPETLRRLPPAILKDAIIFASPGGRTMSFPDGAGLYDNGRGDLIWAWGRGEWNQYELWQFR